MYVRAKFLNEDISNVLKPKTEDDIYKELEELSPEEILLLGYNSQNKNIIRIGIEKANTNIYGFDYDLKRIDHLNPINLWKYYEVDFDGYTAYTTRIADGEEEAFSLLFFASRFVPIYKQKDLDIIKKTAKIANKILNKLI